MNRAWVSTGSFTHPPPLCAGIRLINCHHVDIYDNWFDVNAAYLRSSESSDICAPLKFNQVSRTCWAYRLHWFKQRRTLWWPVSLLVLALLLAAVLTVFMCAQLPFWTAQFSTPWDFLAIGISIAVEALFWEMVKCQVFGWLLYWNY